MEAQNRYNKRVVYALGGVSWRRLSDREHLNLMTAAADAAREQLQRQQARAGGACAAAAGPSDAQR